MLFYALNVPDHIKYLAVDSNGEMFGYETLPNYTNNEWVVGDRGTFFGIDCPVFNMTDVDWKETLVELR